jgi:hypothetical protein
VTIGTPWKSEDDHKWKKHIIQYHLEPLESSEKKIEPCVVEAAGTGATLTLT